MKKAIFFNIKTRTKLRINIIKKKNTLFILINQAAHNLNTHFSMHNSIRVYIGLFSIFIPL